MLGDAPVGAFGLLGLRTVGLAAFRDPVLVGAAPRPGLCGLTGREFEIAQFPSHEQRPSPGVVLAFREHVPDQHRELAGDRDRGDMGAAPGAHTFVERPHRAGAAHRLPCGLDQEMACLAAATLGDPAVMRPPVAGLPDARIEADIGHKLLRGGKAVNPADRRHHPDSHDHVDSGDRHETPHVRVVERDAGNIALDGLLGRGLAVIFLEMALDRDPFVLGQDLCAEPGAALAAELYVFFRYSLLRFAQTIKAPLADPNLSFVTILLRCFSTVRIDIDKLSAIS